MWSLPWYYSKGSACYTYSVKYRGRCWLCKDCVSQGEKVIEARGRRNLIAYGDGGMALAIEEDISAKKGIMN